MPELLLDYTQGAFGYRLNQKRVPHEPLARVIQKKSGVPLLIFDAMGGLGRDALMMALLGCDVIFCEPHPMVSKVVQAALEKARGDSILGPVIQQHLQFFPQDASIILNTLKVKPDIIYLDPMFPERKKSSAQVKKEMYWLQEVHAQTPVLFPDYQVTDELTIFRQALKIAKQKVIVKRPLHAPEIDTTCTVSYVKKFSSCRFDCYTVNN